MNQPIDEQALNPEDLSRLYIQRLNDGDIEGLLLLYETDAVMITHSGRVARDTESIRESFELMIHEMVMQSIVFSIDRSSTLQRDNLALISSRFYATYSRSDNPSITREGITSQVANHQSNGTWLFLMTQTVFNAV